MVYVALLRGINVGGKNKIDMKMLRETFEKTGMESVITYINSGNIIFTRDGLSKAEISHMLEEAIHKDFGLQIKVLICSFDEFILIMHSLPETWKNDQHMKSDVMFLWNDIDDASVMDQLKIKPGIDHVKYVSGAILWSVDKEHAAKSGKIKLVGTDVYRKMTIRNVNTTRKIYKLMQEAASG